MSSENSHARFRGLRLIMAVGTSLVSKLGSILLQLVAIPLAVRALGFEMYGVYATLTTTVGFLSLTGVGVGPGLTKAIARARATGDRESEVSYFTTALLLLFGAASLSAAIVYGGLTWIPGTTVFGDAFAPHQAVIHQCAPLLALLVFIDVGVSVFERTQAGYQEVHRTNLWGAAGNLAAGITLFLGIHRFPSVEFWIIAVYGIQGACRVANAVMMCVQRHYLLTHGIRFSRSKAKELIGDGLAFTCAHSVSPLLLREGGKLLASHLGGPAAAGVYSVLNQIATFLGGFITMVTMPLWPALMDSAARHDYEWFDRMRKRVWGATLAYAGIAGIGLTLCGSWLIERWLGGQVHIGQDVLLAFSCCYLASAWMHVNYVCVTGLGIIVAPAVILIVEAILSLVAGWVGMHWAGMPGLLWGIVSVMACLSAWMFPAMLIQRLRLHKALGVVALVASASPL